MKKILLVEDDTPSAFLVQRIIKSLFKDEIQLETTNNGPEGLSKAQTNKYDYALIDLRLPGVDGSVICTEIKSKHPDTKIALYTASILDHHDICADIILRKPINVQVLIDFLKS